MVTARDFGWVMLISCICIIIDMMIGRENSWADILSYAIGFRTLMVLREGRI